MGSDRRYRSHTRAWPYFNPRSRMGSDVVHQPPELRARISIHAPAWGATRGTGLYACPQNFNPRSRMGSDTPRWSLALFAGYFNPRSRMGSDYLGIQSSGTEKKFQSTLPHGERHLVKRRHVAVAYFNPRSRMGSDPIGINIVISGDVISIHAPAWGATQGNAARMVAYQFQSTLPHGERPDSRHSQDMSCYFNPRSRMGSDSRRWMDLRCAGFQSTLPHGERHPSPIRSTSTWYFNPRSRMGSDGGGRQWRIVSRDFNPRSRMGSDLGLYGQLAAERRISIHAPAWGATAADASGGLFHVISIHAPAWGATLVSMVSLRRREEFQSTLPHGERLYRDMPLPMQR